MSFTLALFKSRQTAMCGVNTTAKGQSLSQGRKSQSSVQQMDSRWYKWQMCLTNRLAHNHFNSTHFLKVYLQTRGVISTVQMWKIKHSFSLFPQCRSRGLLNYLREANFPATTSCKHFHSHHMWQSFPKLGLFFNPISKLNLKKEKFTQKTKPLYFNQNFIHCYSFMMVGY